MSYYDVKMALRLFIKFCLIVIEVNTKFVVTPKNMAVDVTSPVILRCAVDTNIILRWYKITGSEHSAVFNGIEIANNVSMIYSIGRDPTNSSYNLMINSTGMLEAGKYDCVEPFPPIVNRSVELIVLDCFKCRHSRFNESSETVFVLTCSVSFRGNWAPVLEWRFENSSEPIISKELRNDTYPNDNITSTLKVHVPMNTTYLTYSCTTKFIESMRPNATDAKNVPDYNSTVWISPYESPENFSHCIERTTYIPDDTTSISTSTGSTDAIDTNSTRVTTGNGTTGDSNQQYIFSGVVALLVLSLLGLLLYLRKELVKKRVRSTEKLQTDSTSRGVNDGVTGNRGAGEYELEGVAVESNFQRNNAIVGADGITYEDVSKWRKPNSSLRVVPQSHRTFVSNKSDIYASIDHQRKLHY